MVSDDDTRDERRSRAWLMLNAKAQSWAGWSPAAHGGLRQADIAAMLNGLEQHEEYAGRLCIAEQWEYRWAVAKMLYDYTDHLCDREQWNLPTGTGRLRSLVILALIEATCGTVECRQCGGSGRLELPGGVGHESCEPCEGTGRLPQTNLARAEIAEVSEVQWHRVWKSKYRAVSGELKRWVDTARNHVARGLRGAHNRRIKTCGE